MSTPWITAFIVLCGVVLLLGLIVLGTLRRLAPLIEQAEASLAAAAERAAPRALPAGASVPPFAAETLDGATFSELDLRGSRTVVLFVGAACAACERLVDALENGYAPHLDARLVTVTESAEEARRFARSAHVTVVVDEERSIAAAFESEIVPHAFVVDEGTVLTSGRPNDWDGVKALLMSTEKGGDHQADAAKKVLTSR